MAIDWIREGCDLACDPHSNASITRLTRTPMSNINIYCEQPCATPDGKRIAYIRAPSHDPRIPPFTLCVADLSGRRKNAVIEPVVSSHMVATASWSGLVYYLRPNGELICVDLQTLEKQIVITHWDLPESFMMQSVSPDPRYVIGVLHQPDYSSAIVRIDTRQRGWEVLYQHEDSLSHLQYNPVHGRDILVQRNPGLHIDHLRRIRYSDNHRPGAVHFYIGADGSNERPLPLGEPTTAGTCGHAAWIADTARIGVAVRWPGMSVRPEDIAQGIKHDDRHRDGNFLTVGPDDEKPIVFPAPDRLFNHVNVSKCGRYFVCHSYHNGIPGPVEIVVGNIQTGKYRTLVSDCGAQCGEPACSHPHAYFTADNHHVIYNSDPDAICHVHAARVPDGFLDGLE